MSAQIAASAAQINAAPAAEAGPKARKERVAGGMGFAEFILLIAALMSMVALSVDIMLPALPRIETELDGVAGPWAGKGEYVVFALTLGMAVTPLPIGLAADAFGRRAPLLAALALFAVGGVVCALAPDFETMLVGRFLQGAGVVGPRIIAVAVVRDLFEGRRMASVMSVVIMVFIAVPAVAPALGLVIEGATGWRTLFVGLTLFSAALVAWILLRLPETLPAERRRPIQRKVVLAGLRAALTRRRAVYAMLATGAYFAAFLAYIGSAHRVFGEMYGFGDNFVFVFGAFALCIGGASFVNARLVERIGVRRLLGLALRGLIVVSVIALFVFGLGDGAPPFALYAIWCAAMTFCFGLAFGNLNALAMHALGDIAGLGAAMVTTAQNLCAALGASLITGSLTTSPIPLVVGFLVCGGASMMMVWLSDHGTADGTAL